MRHWSYGDRPMMTLLLFMTLGIQEPVNLNEVYRVGWDHPEAVPVGLEKRFNAYVDGVAINPLVGPPDPGGFYSVFMPPIPTAGLHRIQIGVRWSVADSTQWVCGTPPAVPPNPPVLPRVISCGEVLSETLTISVGTTTVPISAPGMPTNLQIIKR